MYEHVFYTMVVHIHIFVCVKRNTDKHLSITNVGESEQILCFGLQLMDSCNDTNHKNNSNNKNNNSKKKQKLSNTWAKHAINKPKTTFILVAISEMIEWMHECLNMDMDVYSCP